MAELVLFGGTTEGRRLARRLAAGGAAVLLCVATDYGASLLAPGGGLRLHCGRLDADGVAALLRREQPRLVVDATHPYAAAASANIRAACATLCLPCLRLRREASRSDGCFCFSGLADMIAWLNERPGIVFSTLGAKEAAQLTALRGFAQRVWLRILPDPAGLGACLAAGFPAQHIVCMQGPFSVELNAALFAAARAEILLTKDSGAAGGCAEKLAAAAGRNMAVAMLQRPAQADGLPYGALCARIEEMIR